jgi:hypothetical protein
MSRYHYAWLNQGQDQETSDQLLDCYYDVSGRMSCARDPGSWVKAMALPRGGRDSLGEVPDEDGSQMALDAMNAMTLSHSDFPLNLPGLPRLAAQPIPGAPRQPDAYKPVSATGVCASAASKNGPPKSGSGSAITPPPVGAGAPWSSAKTGQDVQIAAAKAGDNRPKTAEGFWQSRYTVQQIMPDLPEKNLVYK